MAEGSLVTVVWVVGVWRDGVAGGAWTRIASRGGVVRGRRYMAAGPSTMRCGAGWDVGRRPHCGCVVRVGVCRVFGGWNPLRCRRLNDMEVAVRDFFFGGRGAAGRKRGGFRGRM